MTEFLLALAAFVLAHLVPSMPGVRPRLVGIAGRSAYMVAYSAVSLALLGWLVTAARRADDVWLWQPAAWQWLVPAVLMPVSLVLLVLGLGQPNPLSVSIRRADTQALPAAAAFTRHPVLWGFLLWALSHIPANGRLVPIILFGAMAAMAALGMPMLDRKAGRRLGEEAWTRLSQAPRPLTRADVPMLAVSALVAVAVYGWMLWQGHVLLIGPDPLSGLRAFFG
jgi:uncharacterized membrane protein